MDPRRRRPGTAGLRPWPVALALAEALPLCLPAAGYPFLGYDDGVVLSLARALRLPEEGAAGTGPGEGP